MEKNKWIDWNIATWVLKFFCININKTKTKTKGKIYLNTYDSLFISLAIVLPGFIGVWVICSFKTHTLKYKINNLKTELCSHLP